MKKSTRITLKVLTLLAVAAYACVGVLVISNGQAQTPWWLVTALLAIAVFGAMHSVWLIVFKIIDLAREPVDGPFGRTAPLDEIWGRVKK